MPPRSRGRQSSGPQSVKQLSSPPRPLWRLPPSSITPTPTPRPASQWMLRTRQLAGEQVLDGIWCPVAFFSKKLSKAERKYSAFDRELLAIFLAVKHFRHHVEGLQFAIFTDHKPLTFAFASAAERSPRQTRHMSFISEFSTNVLHVSGKDNVVADALSQPDISAISLPTIDYRQLAADQATSEEIAAYKTSITGLRFDNVQFDGCTVLCDVSWVNLGRWSLESGQRGSLMPFTALHMPAAARRSGPSPHASCGMG